MAIFADVQYCIYADKVGGVQKCQKYDDVIQGWSQTMFTMYGRMVGLVLYKE